MKIGLIVVGLIIGAMLSVENHGVFGGLTGAAIGLLFALLAETRDKLTILERNLIRLDQTAVDKPAHDAIPEFASDAQSAAVAPNRIEEAPATIITPNRTEPAETTEWTVPPPAAPGAIERLFSIGKKWITTGNVPVKMGVIVSFFGVAFLFKYAVDNDLLLLPIEYRLIGASVFGMVLMGVGWRLRERLPTYALSLQGGGVGVLYLTIFAAMQLFELLPAGLSFLLLVTLTLSAGALAVLQNSRALAIFAVVGGFLAPVLTSTGSGDHVLLFSYYLVLNGAILGIAWFRAWRLLNLIGFAFTFIIGGAWGATYYETALFATTAPFLFLYFIFYQGVAILFAYKQPPNLKGLVDGTLVFGTPVISFALQSQVVAEFEYGLAISAVVLALMYLGTAYTLIRSNPTHFRLLIESFLALAVAFATIAIPLALDARWTAAAWAMEGAALVWIGVRQKRTLAKLVGAALTVFSGAAFANFGWQSGEGILILNGNFIGGLLVGVAALFSSFYFSKDPDSEIPYGRYLKPLLFGWGLLWCLGSGLKEVSEQFIGGDQATGYVVYLSAMMIVLYSLAQRLDWMVARLSVLGFMPLLLLPVFRLLTAGSHPFAHLGWLAWPMAFAVQYFVLTQLRIYYPTRNAALHTVTFLAISGLSMWELVWQINRFDIGPNWAACAAAIMPGLIVITMMAVRTRLGWLQANKNAYLGWGSGVLVLAQLVIIAALNLTSNGAITPLPYIPVLNPVDIASAFVVLSSARWLVWLVRDQGLASGDEKLLPTIRALVGYTFAVSTAALIRAIHHLGGVAWEV